MSHKKLQRLVLVTSDFHYRDDCGTRTTSAFMRFVPELLLFSNQIEVCVPIHPGGPTGGYTIESERISYRPLPPSRTLEEFLRRLPGDSAPLLRGLYGAIRPADLVWINGPHPLCVMAVLVARLLRRPYVLWLRGDILEATKAKYSGGGWRNLLALRTAQCLDRLILLAARRAVVFYTGQGLARYAQQARYAQAANSSLVRPEQLRAGPRAQASGSVRLLWAGQLRPVKGLHHLLQAIRILLDEGTPVQLLLVGDGELREVLQSEVEDLGLQRHVQMVGYVAPGPGLERYFEESDVFVLPSLSEGVPKVLFEAMARALPVVASGVGGVPEVVRPGYNGLLTPPGEPAALADAIRDLWRKPAVFQQLSVGALEYARHHTASAEARRIRDGLMLAFPQLWSTHS